MNNIRLTKLLTCPSMSFCSSSRYTVYFFFLMCYLNLAHLLHPLRAQYHYYFLFLFASHSCQDSLDSNNRRSTYEYDLNEIYLHYNFHSQHNHNVCFLFLPFSTRKNHMYNYVKVLRLFMAEQIYCDFDYTCSSNIVMCSINYSN